MEPLGEQLPHFDFGTIEVHPKPNWAKLEQEEVKAALNRSESKLSKLQQLRLDLQRKARSAEAKVSKEAEKAKRQMLARVKSRVSKLVQRRVTLNARMLRLVRNIRLRTYETLESDETMEDLEEEAQVRYFVVRLLGK